MTRILTLDYLRGLAALLILVYHFYAWQGYNIDATDFLGRVGFYGVTIFYMLSGLTLYYVYNSRLNENRFSLSDFFIKRIARIHPLLIAVTFAAIVLYRPAVTALDLLLNITGLFGFFKWDTYYATGVWSIGNELTFYALFPILLITSKKRITIFYAIIALLFAISLYFSFYSLPLKKDYWSDYINPLNQAIYFALGVLLGKVLSGKIFSQKTLIILFVLSLATFTFYPTEKEKIAIVSGLDRYILSLCCFVIVGSVALIKPFNSSLLNKPLVLLGEISYSLYLIHPLVYKALGILNGKLSFMNSDIVYFGLVLLLSLICSWISYNYFEKPLMKRIASININKRSPQL